MLGRSARKIGDREIVGQVIGGAFDKIVVRQKAGLDLEIGDILVLDGADYKLLLNVFDLQYASQIDDKMQEMISGVTLEEQPDDLTSYEGGIVNYVIASVKPLVRVEKAGSSAAAAGGKVPPAISKSLPPFSGKLRPVSEKDLLFLGGDEGLFVGNIRSGSEVKAAGVRMPIKKVFTHHVLIPATTGRGKSNLVKSMLWHVLDSPTRVGILVLDAHDEYYGRGREAGLKDHACARDRLAYYTAEKNTPPGTYALTINLKSIKPHHFDGIVEFSDAQLAAIHGYHTRYGDDWISRLMTDGRRADGDGDNEPGDDAGAATRGQGGNSGTKPARSTMAVIQRKLRMLLGIDTANDGRSVFSRNGIFDPNTRGEATAGEIVGHVEAGRIVILDTSQLHSEAELVVGNIIATELLEKYKSYKASGDLNSKPVVSIVIEEAPRVIGEDVLKSKNDNIYATIAREGRKFKVGLVAITQLSSVIPRSILANMNTKIILGNEMRQEREALMASAAQDLSNDDKNIASLNPGEAIITSVFVPFAIPVKIPLFEDLIARAAGTRPPAVTKRVFG